jgi:hypothetical protein
MTLDLHFRHVAVDSTEGAESGDGARLLVAMTDEMRVFYDGLDLNAPDMPQAGARELGYRPIANFTHNPVATFFGEKQL